MRRAGNARPKASVTMSLFPFLAVLICTMGSLIVLLVVVVRQAQVQAATTAKEAVKEQQDKMKIAREMAQLRVSMMKNSKMREKTEADLAEARLKLGHVEDHSRQLREELTGLMKAWNELEESGNYENKNSEELAARLADIQARIVEADRRLKEVRDSAARKPRSFAIVPYQGAHETRRRPIYIECRENSVVLQPEGIVFTEEDFEGPLGPGNPLAAALRTVREHMLMREDFDPNNSTGETLEDSVEPYPLLLIRPGGIAAYYAARAAMKSWNAELGYELIDADWELEFQPPDPRLAELIGQEIKVARLRQRRLAAAAPRIHAGSRGGSHAGSRRREYTVSHGIGGVVPYGDTGDGYDDDDFGRGHGGAFGRYGGSPRNGGQYARGGSAGGNALRGTGDGSGFQSHGMTTPGENPYGGARDGSQSSGQSGSYLFGDGTGTDKVPTIMVRAGMLPGMVPPAGKMPKVTPERKGLEWARQWATLLEAKQAEMSATRPTGQTPLSAGTVSVPPVRDKRQRVVPASAALMAAPAAPGRAPEPQPVEVHMAPVREVPVHNVPSVPPADSRRIRSAAREKAIPRVREVWQLPAVATGACRAKRAERSRSPGPSTSDATGTASRSSAAAV